MCWLPQYPETQYYCSESAWCQRGNFTLLCSGKLCILFSRSHCNVHFQLKRALCLIQRGDIDIGDQISACDKATVKTPFKFNKATGKESSAALLFSEQNWESCTRCRDVTVSVHIQLRIGLLTHGRNSARATPRLLYPACVRILAGYVVAAECPSTLHACYRHPPPCSSARALSQSRCFTRSKVPAWVYRGC